MQVLVHEPTGWRDGDDFKAELAQSEGHGAYVWAIADPDQPDDVTNVEKSLGITQRAIAAASTRRLRTHLDLVDGIEVLALATVWFTPENSAVETGEITCLVTDRCAVTVERGSGGVTDRAREMLGADRRHGDQGPSSVLRAVAVAVVESAEQVGLDLGEAVERLEKSVFSQAGITSVEEIYELKREVSEARRAFVPLSATLMRVVTDDDVAIPKRARTGLRQLSTASVRTVDLVDALDRMLGDMLSAHLAMVSVQQNNDMRKISAWAAMIAVPTMIAGIYGMNFTHMPELSWEWGYAGALGLMAVACFIVYRILKRSGWF